MLGATLSTDFPTQAPAQNGLRGYSDFFISKFDSEGECVFSTYLGGSNTDTFLALETSASGGTAVAGSTTSPDFPVTSGQPPEHSRETFVTKLGVVVAAWDAQGRALVATYVGGSGDERIYDVRLGPSEEISVTGFTTSTDLHLRNPAQASYGGVFSDVFLITLAF